MMAERILREGGGTLDQQIAYGFRLAIARYPNSRELKLLKEVYDEFLSTYEDDRSAADRLLTVGEFPRAKGLDSVQLAAMTMLASTIMNLDEAVTKE